MTRIKKVFAGLAFLFAIGFAFASSEFTTQYAYKVQLTGECISMSEIPDGCQDAPGTACVFQAPEGQATAFKDVNPTNGTLCDVTLSRINP